MSAKCYGCLIGHKFRKAGIGTNIDPLGVCTNCQALFCGHHGVRDPVVPEYRCVICDSSLLAASGVVKAAEEGDRNAHRAITSLSSSEVEELSEEEQLLRTLLQLYRRRDALRAKYEAFANSAENFIDRLPGSYGEDIWSTLEEKIGLFETISERDPFRVITDFPYSSLEMISLSIVLLAESEAASEYPPVLIDLSHRFGYQDEGEGLS